MPTSQPQKKGNKIRIADIVAIPELDIRPIDWEHVKELEPHIDQVPPILVVRGSLFNHSGKWALIGGKHRTEAANNRKRKWIRAEEFSGTKREAIAKAWEDNSHHGRKLTRQERNQAYIELSRLGYNFAQIHTLIGGAGVKTISRIVKTDMIRHTTTAIIDDVSDTVLEEFAFVPSPYWQHLVDHAKERRWRNAEARSAARVIAKAARAGLAEEQIKGLQLPGDGRILRATRSNDEWQLFNDGLERIMRFKRDWAGEMPENPSDVRYILSQLEYLEGFIERVREGLQYKQDHRLVVVPLGKEG